MGFRRTRGKTFFVCGIRDWLQNCRGIRDSNICWIPDSNICEMQDRPENYHGIRDSNISQELEKVRNFFSVR